MLRLGIDASTPQGSVALADGERLLAETTLPLSAGGSEAALPEIDRLLGGCGRRVAEVEGVVVGSGPGSFTGVRIAASLAKGLCGASGGPLFAYSSLTAAAVGSGLEGRVCAAFDARRGQLYAAAYPRLDPPRAEIGPAALTPEELLEELTRPAAWNFVGQGATLHAGLFEGVGGRVLPPYLGVPRAAALLWLAARWPDEGRVEDPADWEPDYVRRSGAVRAGRAVSGERRGRSAELTEARGAGGARG